MAVNSESVCLPRGSCVRLLSASVGVPDSELARFRGEIQIFFAKAAARWKTVSRMGKQE